MVAQRISEMDLLIYRILTHITNDCELEELPNATEIKRRSLLLFPITLYVSEGHVTVYNYVIMGQVRQR